MNIVTSYDQSNGLTVGGVRPVVFLNAVTPGNWGFVQELGVATVLARTTLTATPAIGDVIISIATGVVDDPTQSGNPTYALLKEAIGTAIDLPTNGKLFRILMNYVPVVQG